MKQKLLTKHCAMLLLALAAALSTQAWADVTVNVKTSSAPFIYAWDNNQNKLTANEFPGDEMTETKVVNGITYYTRTFEENSINLLFATNSSTKSVDFYGITGEVFFNYNGITQAYGILPNGVKYESNGYYAYFVNTNNWDKVYAYIFGDGDYSAWPGTEMVSVGDDGTGKSVYKFGPVESPKNFTKIIFTNYAGTQTADLDFTNGGYYYLYSTGTDCVATIDANRITNSSTYFGDANFRQAITSALGVQENEAFTPSDITVLDVSNQGVTNVNGLNLFTKLEEFYARDNEITTFGYSPQQSTLRILDLSKNSGLKTTMSSYTESNYTLGSGRIYILGFSNLEELILDDCDFGGTSGGGIGIGSSSSVLPKLRVFSAKNNPNLESMSTLKNGAHLEYINLSNCGLTRDALNKTHFEGAGGANLKYIDVSNNSNLYYLYVTDKTGLETIIMKSCTAYDYGSFDHCPNLKHADFSGCTALASDMWNHLKPEVHTQLQYLNLSNGTTNVNGHTFSFPALDTLIINNHGATLTQLNINTHCPSVIDITNNTHLANIAITNCGLTQATMPTITATGATSLYKLDLTNNAFTDVPTTGISTLTTLVMNNNQLSDINVSESNIHYLYAQNNNFGGGAYTLPTTSLVGLDLGNNGFTKFKAENNTSLKSLALGGNDDLTEIELHGNTALTQTSPDGVIESDNGLYIKELSNLQTLNIENSSFNKLGQQNSLEGLTSLTKLQARHNEFTTFTNSDFDVVAGGEGYRPKDPTQSSLERLTALEYLDLAYNHLRDSVHLYRNVALKHLDVSYNRSIDGQADPTFGPKAKSEAEKLAILEKKGRNFMKYGRVGGKTYAVNATETQWNTHFAIQQGRERPFDLRPEDLNDTTGLYHLDLKYNVDLEWLDISYTNIHNTSAGPTHMNPGWVNKDWVQDLEDYDPDSNPTFSAEPKDKTPNNRGYSSWHTFVYFIPCTKLKVIHADHNNMRSLGIRYFTELDTLTCSYMYGDSEIMRDYKSGSSDLRYGMGNTGISTSIKKFHHVDWDHLDSDGYPTIVLWGPNESTADSDVYPSKLRYWDLSYSGYNEVRLFPGSYANDLPYLEYVNVSGNPLNFTTHASNANYATTSNWNSLDVTYCPNIRTVLAENCSDLPIVRAHNRTKLDTLYLSNDPKLKVLYVQNDPVLKANFQGLNTLTGLETLFGYNNTKWGGIDVSNNTALKNLWVSNIKASSINIANNANLEKLRAYDNSLTALDLSNNGELLWLDVARNKLPEIDLSGNTKLQFFNISNGSDTRTQLDGTEALNHDGSDGDNIKPTTIFSADETPIANANYGNSLSDLALPASIIDARANGNDLHCIKPVQGGSFTNLANIEFAHNHINGIDLSDAPSATIESRDNGRTIVADFATFKVKDNNNQIQEYKVYFFQLENLEEPNGTILTDKESKDLKLASRHLGDDGLALDKISKWGSNNSGILTKSGTTVTPDNMGDILDPDQIPGKIVVLVPEDVNESTNEASGHATYTYTTGPGSEGSEFYLNWTSNGTVTGLNIVGMPLDNVSITNTYGNLTVAGADGTVVGVYDLNGRLVASETISGGTLTIDGLAPGIYVVNGVKVVIK